MASWYDPRPALDPTTVRPVTDVTAQVYAMTDTSRSTPLVVEDASHLPITTLRITNYVVPGFWGPDEGCVIQSTGLVTPVVPIGGLLATAQAAAQSAASVATGIESRLAALESGITGASMAGTVIKFSTLSGATDDDKLAAGIALANVPVLKGRTILLDENRDYTFTRQVTIPTGFSLMGPFRPQDQARSSRPIGNRVLLRLAGSSAGKGWLKIGPGSTFGVTISNLSIDGDINSALIDGSEDNGGVLWTTQIRDISMQNGLSVAGLPGNKLLVTADTFGGFWNINNIRYSAFHIGGSDFVSSPEMMLIDSPPELLDFNQSLVYLDFMTNGHFKHGYLTAEGHGGILIDGSNNTSTCVYIEDWPAIEGRNANQPSPGALLRMNRGQVMVSRCRFAYGMANPALITARTDRGVIHVAGGNATISECVYERGNQVTAWNPPASPTIGSEVPETTPFVYVAAGAKARVRNIAAVGPTTGARSWVGKPMVLQALPGLADVDNSVVLATALAATAPTAAGDTTSTAANTGTTVTVAKPANTVNGDVLIAALYSRNGTVPFTTPPTGWTVMPPASDITTAGLVRLYFKVITNSAGEPTSYTWSGGGSGRNLGMITRVIGSTASPFDAAGAVSTEISTPERIILPALSTTGESELLVSVGCSNNTGAVPPFTMPDGGSVIASVQTNTGASESYMALGVEAGLATGATGTRRMLGGGTSGVGYMAAIRSGNGYTITSP